MFRGRPEAAFLSPLWLAQGHCYESQLSKPHFALPGPSLLLLPFAETWSRKGAQCGPVNGSGLRQEARPALLPCVCPWTNSNSLPVVTAPTLGPWQERAGKCHCRRSRQGEM